MAFEVVRARREQSKLLIGLTGSTGSGKTHSALVIAQGMVQTIQETMGDEYKGKGICVIDSEAYRSTYYADIELEGSNGPLKFDIINISKPYSPERYIEAIQTAEEKGYDVIIVDSISHEWNGTGGILEIVNQLGKVMDKGGNFTVWAKVTPRHNAFVESLTSSHAHIITTMRTKPHWVVEKDSSGKHKPRKVGTEPQQREGLEYELTILLQLDDEHNATVGNDRTKRLGEIFIPTHSVGRNLIEWQMSGTDPKEITSLQATLREAAKEAGTWADLKAMVIDLGKEFPPGLPTMWDIDQLKEAVDVVKEINSGE